MELTGKRILVTGGARRVGAALVRHFAGAGAQVVIHCNRSLAEAERLAQETGSEVVSADLRKDDCVERIFQAAPFDVLINNASIYRKEDMDAFSPAVFQEYMQIHYDAPMGLIRRFAMQKRTGIVINILDSAVLNLFGGGAYAVSRRAMARATLSCAQEYAPSVRINAVAPGPMLPPEFLPESRMKKSIARLPLRRAVALSDLCCAVQALVENESITGAILPVDCGDHLLFSATGEMRE